MKKWTYDKLISKGYQIQNAKITRVSLNMKNCGCFSLDICLEGGGWGCVYGGRCLGKGYLGAEEFTGYAAGMESIMRIMDIVGVDDLMDLEGKYVRAATSGIGSSVTIIGNIIEDRWFDYGSFFDDKDKEW